MKAYVLCVKTFEFTDEKTGEIRKFGQLWMLQSPKVNTATMKGQQPQKMSAPPSIMDGLKAEDLPGFFDVDITLGGMGDKAQAQVLGLTPSPRK